MSKTQADLQRALAEIRGPRALAADLAEIRGQAGNIDLTKRPRVKNADGSVSTVRSMSFNEDGKEILVPTVSDDGRILSNDEAIDLYHRTGKHLGKFASVAQADSAANAIHEQQAGMLAGGAPKKRDIHEEYRSGDLAKRMARENANDREQMESEDPDRSNPSFAQKALGGVASIAREIPGAEFLQAGARSLVRRQPYGEALEDIRGAEDALPWQAQVATRLPGAVLSSMALPGSNLAKGAMYGGLRGWTAPEPDADRTMGTLAGATVGAALGATGDAAGAGARGIGRLIRKQGGKEIDAAKSIWKTLRPGRLANPPAPPPSGPTRLLQPQTPIATAPQPPAAAVPPNPLDEMWERYAVDAARKPAPVTSPEPFDFSAFRGARADRPLGKVETFMTPHADVAKTYADGLGAEGAVHEIGGTFANPLRGSVDDIGEQLGLRKGTPDHVKFKVARERGHDGVLITNPDGTPNVIVGLDNGRLVPKAPVAASAPSAPSQAAPVGDINELITSMLGKIQKAQPHETGNIWGDAEIAQGLHLPPQDLEALLRQSLQAKPRLVNPR